MRVALLGIFLVFLQIGEGSFGFFFFFFGGSAHFNGPRPFWPRVCGQLMARQGFSYFRIEHPFSVPRLPFLFWVSFNILPVATSKELFQKKKNIYIYIYWVMGKKLSRANQKC